MTSWGQQPAPSPPSRPCAWTCCELEHVGARLARLSAARAKAEGCALSAQRTFTLTTSPSIGRTDSGKSPANAIRQHAYVALSQSCVRSTSMSRK